MNCVSSSDLSLKYKRFSLLDCQDIRIRKFELVTKTQFLSQVSKRSLSEIFKKANRRQLLIVLKKVNNLPNYWVKNVENIFSLDNLQSKVNQILAR